MKKYILVLLVLLSVNTFAQTKASFKVDGACGMCQSRIEQEALKFEFVETASWNKDDKVLKLVLTKTSDTNQVQKALANLGHDTEKYKATDATYDNLPLCCHYRNPDSHDHQNIVHGRVYEKNTNGKKVPLNGVNVYWEGTIRGTAAGKHGTFLLEKVSSTNKLTISYAGYESRTVEVNDEDFVVFIFDENKMLEEVVVTYRKKPTTTSFLKALKIQDISEGELQKAACCNLSESFETNPSVDVSSTDAVTGTKQIEMLGLAGSYVQITRENMPDTRGLSTLFGLAYTPGTWIQSIQLNTGTGSVVNGFESVTGQINVELKKPENSEKLYVNAYANSMGRIEGNVNLSHKLNEHWSTGVMLHSSLNKIKWDKNNDGFLDAPIGDNFIALNRWKFSGDNNWEAQFGVKAVVSDKQGGQVDFDIDNPNSGLWGSRYSVSRYEAWAKIGNLINDHSSFGLQLSGMMHDQDAYFGNRNYDATQESFYVNAIYQYSFNESNEVKTGLSLQLDNYDENVDGVSYLRNELVTGVFGEYTYKYHEKFTAVFGARVDNHNNYGLFVTPRIHFRYAFVEKSVLRASFGRGQKTASIFAENIGAFASSRNFVIHGDGSSNPYGLDVEVAYNYGLNYSYGFEVFEKDVVFNVDYFYTDFQNQIVVDFDSNAQEVNFYNLKGKSYSHSFQTQFDVELSEYFDVRMAYRYNDVKTTYGNELLNKPLVAKNRALVNIAYATDSNWKFDATYNWVGSKRIANTFSNPIEYQALETSPSYSLVNAQISKAWHNEMFDVYIGVENLLDYRQEDAIISADNPQSPYFDASMIWGPVFGRNIYLGFRYKIN